MAWRIHTAACQGDVVEIEWLFIQGADIDVLNDDGWTPMHTAAKRGHVSVIEALVRLGSTAIDTPNRWGSTPIFIAALYGRASVIEALVRLGSTAFDTHNRYGWVPLDVSGKAGKSEAMKTLRALGAGLPLEDEDEAHEIRWRVYFRDSLVEKLLFAASTCENVPPVKR